MNNAIRRSAGQDGLNGNSNSHPVNRLNGHVDGHQPDAGLNDDLPPQNLEAERWLLGAILLDNNVLEEITTFLTADDFYREAHQVIYRTISELHAAGKPVDPVLLADELTRRDQFKQIGGDEMLLEIGNTPHAKNAVYHAGIVKQKSIARQLIQNNADGIRDAYSNLFTAEQLVESQRRKLESISSTAAAAIRHPGDFATLADVRREASGDGWLWRGWIPSSRLWGIAAFEGVGKTRFSMDLARRWWFGLEMPDGQPSTISAGTPTLWVCADGQQDDLLEIAAAYGLPDNSVFLNTEPLDPYGGSSIDEVESISRLEAGILCIRPACVFIDTLTNATGRDLCKANEAKLICSPLNEIAKRTKTAVCLDCHVALNGKALGKRVRGWTRTMIAVECPDAAHPERLKIYPEKTFAKRPEPLGATMGDSGTEYDHNPPVAPDVPKGGKLGAPSKAKEQAAELIRGELAMENDQTGNDLQAKLSSKGVSRSTFWRAIDDMVESGGLITDGGKGTGHQTILHLNSTDKAF